MLVYRGGNGSPERSCILPWVTQQRSWSQDSKVVLSDSGTQDPSDSPDCLALVGGYQGFCNSYYKAFHTFSCIHSSYLPQEARTVISPLSR